ncbi:MAG: molybdenum cofactor biosynthesis protein [Proteobacteria bacterium]|nr:molybdenum cofactor biosynthesis protein [Pseudomonadota bacterium]
MSHRHGGAPEQHRSYAPESVGCSLLTVSDSRTLENDSAGSLIEAALAGAGHRIERRAIVRDEAEGIRAAVREGIESPEVDAVIVCGGTGVAPRDVTPEAVGPLLEKRLDGFGELFRALSFAEIGTAAMLSRALAGVAGRTAVYVMPGSSAAAKLGVERLILPELTHLVGQLRRSG